MNKMYNIMMAVKVFAHWSLKFSYAFFFFSIFIYEKFIMWTNLAHWVWCLLIHLLSKNAKHFGVQAVMLCFPLFSKVEKERGIGYMLCSFNADREEGESSSSSSKSYARLSPNAKFISGNQCNFDTLLVILHTFMYVNKSILYLWTL